MVPDDSAGPVDVTESVPLTAEALEKLFWQKIVEIKKSFRTTPLR